MPLVVVGLAEGIEATLLGAQIRLRRSGGLGLQGLVHALVCAVLLGLAGVDQFAADAETDPPDGQPGEPAQGIRGEGHAVVGSDAFGQSVRLEETPEGAQGIAFTG